MNPYILETLDGIKMLIRNLTDVQPSSPFKYANAKGRFTRNRKITPFKLVLFILLQTKKSLAITVDSFFRQMLGNDAPPTPSAVCKRRGWLSYTVFSDLLKGIAGTFYSKCRDARRWKGYSLRAVDGSSITLPRTRKLGETFGFSTNNKGELRPQGKAVVLFDPLNSIVCDAALTPIATGELPTAMGMMTADSLQPLLYIFDRLYASFRLFKNAEIRGVKALCRAKASLSKSVEDFANGDENDAYISLTANFKSVRGLGNDGISVSRGEVIEVRAVKVALPSGETEILLTNLSQQEATLQELAQLYALRWGMEVAYGILKNEEQLEIFSGSREICIKQDFMAALCLYNIDSIVGKMDSDKIAQINERRTRNNKKPLQIDINFTWHVLREYLYRWLSCSDAESVKILSSMAVGFMDDLITSNAGGHVPRIKKKVKLNGKYITFSNYKPAV